MLGGAIKEWSGIVSFENAENQVSSRLVEDKKKSKKWFLKVKTAQNVLFSC
jgi:hypothetical protein